MVRKLFVASAITGLTGLAGCVNNGNINIFGGQNIGAGPTRSQGNVGRQGNRADFYNTQLQTSRTNNCEPASRLISSNDAVNTSDYFSVPRVFTCNSFRGDKNGNGILDAGDIEGYKRMFTLDEPLTVVAWAPTNQPIELQIYDSRGCKRFDEAYVNRGTGVQLPLCKARDLGPGHYTAKMQLDKCGQGQWYKAADWSFDVDP